MTEEGLIEVKQHWFASNVNMNTGFAQAKIRYTCILDNSTLPKFTGET